MKEKNTEKVDESRVAWNNHEAFARLEIQGWVQRLLEEEINELLGREKSERRAAVDAAAGYRNGYGKPRKLALSSGTICVRRPRVRRNLSTTLRHRPWTFTEPSLL